MQVTTIGLDIAKRVFQVHGTDSEGAVVVRSKLKRSELLHFFQSPRALSRRHRGACDGTPLGA